MADKKISELTSITGANVDDANDTIAIVDSSAGQTKKITRAELFKGVGGATFGGDVTLGGDTNRIGSSTSSNINFNRENGPTNLTSRRLAYSDTDQLFSFIDRSNAPAAIIYGTGTGLNSDKAVVTREKGDARYAQLDGADFTGNISAQNVTTGGYLNLIGNSASAKAFFNYENNNERALLTVQRDGGADPNYYIFGNGNQPMVSNTVLREVDGDARYAKLSGASFAGDVTLEANNNYLGNTSASNLYFKRTDGPVKLYSKRTDHTSAETLFEFFDTDNDTVARVAGKGTSLSTAEAVVTREKGDNRYLPERGSNANGEYVRFPDGTQICTSPSFSADATTAVGSLYKWASNQTWTYPAVFSSVPNVSPAATNNTTLVAAPATVTTTSVSINVLNAVSVAGRGATFVAIGRWF